MPGSNCRTGAYHAILLRLSSGNRRSSAKIRGQEFSIATGYCATTGKAAPEKMPDVILYHANGNWLILVDAVPLHGFINPRRRAELQSIFTNSKAGLVFVTAFLDKRTLQNMQVIFPGKPKSELLIRLRISFTLMESDSLAPIQNRGFVR